MRFITFSLALALLGAFSANVSPNPSIAGQPAPAQAVAIQGQDNWVSVGEFAPQGVELKAGGPRSVKLGQLKFPEGRLRKDDPRDYVGETTAIIKLRPVRRSPHGLDSIQVSIGDWSYSMIELSRTGSKKCPGQVNWTSSGLISGDQWGTTCKREIRIKGSNLLPHGSTGPGAKPWKFTIRSLGRPLVKSVHFSPKSRVGITVPAVSKLGLKGPREITLRDLNSKSIPVEIENHGSRASRKMIVYSWVESGGAIRLLTNKERRLAPLLPGETIKTRIPIAKLKPGRYRVMLGVADRHSEDSRWYRIRVKEPPIVNPRPVPPLNRASSVARVRPGPHLP